MEPEPATTAWNDCDEYTLTLMSNRTHYDKYIKAKQPEDTTGSSHHYNTTFRKVSDFTKFLH